MEKTTHIQSNNIFRQAVVCALMEQAKIDPAPLRTFLVELLEAPPSDEEKIGWLLTDKSSFMAFYDLLKSHEFISCDIELFKHHFIKGTEQPERKIIWRENLNELVYLFARLREEGVIPLSKNQHLLLQKNFLDKYEKPLNPASLRTLLEKSIRNNYRMELINSIVDDVLWQKNNE